MDHGYINGIIDSSINDLNNQIDIELEEIYDKIRLNNDIIEKTRLEIKIINDTIKKINSNIEDVKDILLPMSVIMFVVFIKQYIF